MSIFLKEMVQKKMKQLTSEEIIHYGKQYGFSITENEAKQIIRYLKRNNIDPFTKKDRNRMLQELARITDVETAKKANTLFKKIIKSYGLESLLE